MQIVRELSDLELSLANWAAADEPFSLVPTMGALHDGHLALVAAAKQRTPRAMATIFVNPLQFNDNADLQRYPRSEDRDLAKLDAAGCDLVWLPTQAQLYPDGFATTVRVNGVSRRWEGAHRPGHFEGVATVVTKLLLATFPDFAWFGEKDFQQLAVIRRLVTDLGLPIAIEGVATVRDPDGLALSSRNAHLSPDERRGALALPRSLNQAREAILGGVAIEAALDQARAALSDAGFDPIDYVVLVDADSLEPIEALAGDACLIAAARIGATRLIDNLRVAAATPSDPK